MFRHGDVDVYPDSIFLTLGDKCVEQSSIANSALQANLPSRDSVWTYYP
jgi:hypothetical protein